MKSRSNIGLNAYVQGSVWMWPKNGAADRPGVQSSGRPVLIVSNNAFNQFSPVVNCLTITSNTRYGQMHVPVMIDVLSHIQCEQIHTINKGELTAYRGMVSAKTLGSVKDKLGMQFDLNEDRSFELLNSVVRGVEALNAKVDGVLESSGPDIDAEAAENIQAYTPESAQKDSEPAEDDAQEDKDHGMVPEPENIEKSEHGTSKPEKNKRRKYSEEDKLFIVDGANSIASIVDRFGLKDKRAAYGIRKYFRTAMKDKSKAEASKETAAPKKIDGKRHKYTDDEKQFILDKSNSLQAVADKFGYKNKSVASKMRSHFKSKAKA